MYHLIVSMNRWHIKRLCDISFLNSNSVTEGHILDNFFPRHLEAKLAKNMRTRAARVQCLPEVCVHEKLTNEKKSNSYVKCHLMNLPWRAYHNR